MGLFQGVLVSRYSLFEGRPVRYARRGTKQAEGTPFVGLMQYQASSQPQRYSLFEGRPAQGPSIYNPALQRYSTEQIRDLIRYDKNWREDEHPREHGKFTSKGGGDSGGADDPIAVDDDLMPQGFSTADPMAGEVKGVEDQRKKKDKPKDDDKGKEKKTPRRKSAATAEFGIAFADAMSALQDAKVHSATPNPAEVATAKRSYKMLTKHHGPGAVGRVVDMIHDDAGALTDALAAGKSEEAGKIRRRMATYPAMLDQLAIDHPPEKAIDTIDRLFPKLKAVEQIKQSGSDAVPPEITADERKELESSLKQLELLPTETVGKLGRAMGVVESLGIATLDKDMAARHSRTAITTAIQAKVCDWMDASATMRKNAPSGKAFTDWDSSGVNLPSDTTAGDEARSMIGQVGAMADESLKKGGLFGVVVEGFKGFFSDLRDVKDTFKEHGPGLIAKVGEEAVKRKLIS